MFSSKHMLPRLRWSVILAVPLVLTLVLVFFILPRDEPAAENEEGGKARNAGIVLPAVVAAKAGEQVRAASAPASGFAAPTRMGYTDGFQWEPAIAADALGHAYIFYPQYSGVPGCPACPSPTMILLTSNDYGATWSAPAQIAAPGSGQWDPQIMVDPADGRTVYASWLQNNKSDTVVARSTDFGKTWSTVVADSTKAGTDKPILAVRGQDVYVGFNHAQKVWVAASHDGGKTFNSVSVNPNGKFGWSLAGGATVDLKGNVYFAWAGYTQNGGANGTVSLYISKSANGGKTWTNKVLDTSASPPDCSAFSCGWAFLGAQMTMASDGSGTLYALWNAGSASKGPERIYFAKSTDAGNTWSSKEDISTAPNGVSHAFPAIAAKGPGDVRISWMDTRAGTHWNTMYRSSTDGGTTWSSEQQLSSYVAGYRYIFADGFNFPYGDYYEMDIDGQGNTVAVWGEGFNYTDEGSIWYARGK